MKNINNLLNSPDAEIVFRKHKIASRGMDGVRKGFDAKGSHFMTDLIKAISPGSVLNGNFGDADEMGPPTLDQFAAQNTTGKGWQFWDKALQMIGKTGQTYSDFKNNLLSDPEPTSDEVKAAQNQKSRNTVIYIVAGVIIVTVAVLLFFKKK